MEDLYQNQGLDIKKYLSYTLCSNLFKALINNILSSSEEYNISQELFNLLENNWKIIVCYAGAYDYSKGNGLLNNLILRELNTDILTECNPGFPIANLFTKISKNLVNQIYDEESAKLLFNYYCNLDNSKRNQDAGSYIMLIPSKYNIDLEISDNNMYLINDINKILDNYNKVGNYEKYLELWYRNILMHGIRGNGKILDKFNEKCIEYLSSEIIVKLCDKLSIKDLELFNGKLTLISSKKSKDYIETIKKSIKAKKEERKIDG